MFDRSKGQHQTHTHPFGMTRPRRMAGGSNALGKEAWPAISDLDAQHLAGGPRAHLHCGIAACGGLVGIGRIGRLVARAILDFARSNKVDHIVMGARQSSTMRSLIGSVAGEVAAHAPCTVTVVRNRYTAKPDIVSTIS